MFVHGFDADLQMVCDLEVFLSLQALNGDLGFALGKAPGIAQMLFIARPSRGRPFNHREEITVRSQHSLWKGCAVDLVGYTTNLDVARLERCGTALRPSALNFTAQISS